jgi:hypothetical protein
MSASRRREVVRIEMSALRDGHEERLRAPVLVVDADAEMDVRAGGVAARRTRHDELTGAHTVADGNCMTTCEAVAVRVLRTVVTVEHHADAAAATGRG